MGSTGVGKSTFGNQILGGMKSFGVGHATNSKTTSISYRAEHYLGRAQCITIFDTPGVQDTEGILEVLYILGRY